MPKVTKKRGRPTSTSNTGATTRRRGVPATAANPTPVQSSNPVNSTSNAVTPSTLMSSMAVSDFLSLVRDEVRAELNSSSVRGVTAPPSLANQPVMPIAPPTPSPIGPVQPSGLLGQLPPYSAVQSIPLSIPANTSTSWSTGAIAHPGATSLWPPTQIYTWRSHA